VKIVYFAAVREALDRSEQEFGGAAGVVTISDLLDHLAAHDPACAQAFANRAKLRFALDQRMAKIDAPLGDALELAIFPPVTGG
jgi:sulfur-carrier protein